MLRSILSTLLFLFLALGTQAQAVLQIVQEPICWAAPSGADSSLTRYVLLSSRTPTTSSTLAYTNADGNIVVPTGGSFTPGWCDCCGGGGAGTADNDWYFIDANSIAAPVWRSGRVLIGTPNDLPADTSHQLQLEGDWQFLPDAFGTRFDWQDSADTTGTSWYGILFSAPAGLGGSSNLSGSRNNLTIATSNTVIDRTRLGVLAFGGNNPSDTDHALGAFIEAVADGAWSPTSLGTNMNIWTTTPGEAFPRNTFTFQGDGRFEMDRYFLFSDGVPEALLGYNSTTRDATRHPIAGTPSPGSAIIVNGTGSGLEWGTGGGGGGTDGDILQTVFVAKTNYVGGEKYYISKPILNLWEAKDSLSVGETMVLYPGTYTYTGPYTTNPIAGGFSLAKTDNTDFFINGNATISATGGSGTFYPLFSDVTANYISAETRRFKLFGPSATVSAVRGSQSICIPIGFYGLNSEVDVTLANVFSTGGRSWGVQVGCKRAKINIQNIDITGNIGFGISIGLTPTGIYDGLQTRQIEANIGTIRTQNTGDFRGHLRVQNVENGTDSLSYFKVKVNEIINTNIPSANINMTMCNFRNGLIDYHVGKITDLTVGDPNLSVLCVATRENALLDTLYKSVLKIKIDVITTGNSPFSTAAQNPLTLRGLWMDSTVIQYDLGVASFTSTNSKYDISEIRMLRGGAINFHCDNCVKTANGTLFEVLNSNVFSATSRINISGTYRIKGASPVITLAQAAPIYLNNALLYNDGGLLISSSVPVTIYVVGGSNVKVSDVSANVTLIYLPGTDLTFTGSVSPVILNSSTGADVTLTAGPNTSFSQSGNNLTISATGDGNGIYGGSGTVPNGTGATLIGTMVITNPGGAGLHLNQTSNTHFLGQSSGTRVLVAPTLNQIQIFGNGTTPAETYLYDADASAPVIVRVPSVVNSGGYVMEWPATPPVAGEQLVYTGSNTYDWATKSKIVRFVPAGASPVVVSATFPAYQLLGGFNSTTNTPDWTIASNIDFLYTGTGTKTFVLRFTASGETGTGLPVEFSYEINSAGKVIIATELSANFSVAGQAFVSMAPSDTLRFYVRPTSGVLTGNITNMSGSLEEF